MFISNLWDVRVTARCPHCGKVTVRDSNYRNIDIGEEEWEILDELKCEYCSKVAFTESRQFVGPKKTIIAKAIRAVGKALGI